MPALGGTPSAASSPSAAAVAAAGTRRSCHGRPRAAAARRPSPPMARMTVAGVRVLCRRRAILSLFRLFFCSQLTRWVWHFSCVHVRYLPQDSPLRGQQRPGGKERGKRRAPPAPSPACSPRGGGDGTRRRRGHLPIDPSTGHAGAGGPSPPPPSAPHGCGRGEAAGGPTAAVATATTTTTAAAIAPDAATAADGVGGLRGCDGTQVGPLASGQPHQRGGEGSTCGRGWSGRDELGASRSEAASPL